MNFKKALKSTFNPSTLLAEQKPLFHGEPQFVSICLHFFTYGLFQQFVQHTLQRLVSCIIVDELGAPAPIMVLFMNLGTADLLDKQM